MQTATLFLIVFAGLLALAVALFQYYYRSKKRGRLYLFLALLRFLAVYGLLLLLINPGFTKTEYQLLKTRLIVLLDDSNSIETGAAGAQIRAVMDGIKDRDGLSDRFDMNIHSFGAGLNDRDSLSFKAELTNISGALRTAEDIYGKRNTAVVLATDGNQTFGTDYEFFGNNPSFPVYPVVVGDTTRFEDLRIDRVNANRYAFLKNKFPLEVYTSYQGRREVNALLTVSIDGGQVYRESISFGPARNSHVSNALIEAATVGDKNILISLRPLENERNKANNYQRAIVEIIDEKTDIVIVSSILHPDIGALKKAISSNEQRSVTIKKPDVPLDQLEEADLLLLYQPNAAFEGIYEYVNQKKLNAWTITGPKTDWSFLNRVQDSFEKNSYEQDEEVSARVNSGFSLFDITDFSMEDYPPLETTLGEVLITKANETLMGQVIKGVETGEPLFAIITSEEQKHALLFGEHIWKWRMQSFRNDQSFQNFDEFIGKLIRYLSTDKPLSRLSLDYQKSYLGTGGAIFTASYFDEAFIFDPNATININLRREGNNETTELPMLLRSGYYQADLSALAPGDYKFTVKVQGTNLTRSGQFTILDFNVEQQLLSSDYGKLKRLAAQSSGSLYFPDQLDALLETLMEDPQFAPTRKSNQNVVSLIDFRILLGIIVLALAGEWFLRKYNGLI